MGRKLSFLEFWRSKEERGARLERAEQLKLLPSQLKRLHGDSAVRAALQNVRAASLLPPVGTEVFRRLTAASPEEIQERHAEETVEREKRTKNKEEVDKDHSKPARDLEAGKPLPFFYGDPPHGHLGTPLEELDPYYRSQGTFIVLGKGNIIQRFNAEPALYIIGTAVRNAAIKILTHHSLILLTILINCFFMIMYSSHHATTPLWAWAGEIVFIVIYTLEVMVKVVSRGFCVGRFTFLKDPWNWLDVIVVITTYMAMFIDLDRLIVLATISRVLKIIPLVPGLKMASYNFAKSLKRLTGVFALTAFILSVLSVIGLQVFMGTLRQKCIKLPTQGNQSFLSDDYIYNHTEIILFDYTRHVQDPANHHYREGNHDPLLCGNGSDAGHCPEGFTCVRAGRNPNYGYTSYDAFGWTLLSSLRLMTEDFWDNLMMLTLRANGKTTMNVFVLVFFPGCFLLVSLIVSKFAMAIGEQVEARVAEADQKHEDFGQIVEALKRREEEEAASGAALSEAHRGENENGHTASEGQQQQRQSSCPLCCLFLADLFLKWNCCGCWRWLKQRLYSVVTNPFFDFCIVICLIVDIVFMATNHYPMMVDMAEHLSLASLVFTLIFTVEMLVKMVAMDPYNYFRVSWNVFESVIVALCLAEMFVANIEMSSVLRIFRLARWWPHFRLLLKIAWASVRALRNPTLLLVIVSFMFTVVGWQLFHNDYKDCVCRISADCELPRWHMEDFFHTFILVVRSLCGQWIETLWDCMEVSGKPLCLTFFMTLVVVGDLLILNLFLILLLSPLNSDSLLTVTEEKNNNMHAAVRQIINAICGTWSRIRGQAGNKSHPTAKSQGDNSKDYMALTVVPEDQPASEQMEPETPEDKKTKIDNVQKQHEVQPEQDGGEHQGDEPEDCCCQWCCCPFRDVDTSRGVWKIWANFRRACFLVARHKCFDVFIIVIIMLSTAAMMFEDIYLHERQILKTAVDIVDLVCTCLFLLEMLLKWIGFGLKKYFTDAWCWLDFLILDVFLVSVMAGKLGFSALGTFQFLRTLRALGPLRLLSRFQGLRLVVQVLVQAIPTMFSGLLVIITTWLFFSILGIGYFAGKFYYCFNETSEEYFLAEAVANKSDCVSLIDANYHEVRWKNTKLNYDNVMNGYVSLLHLGFSEGWFDIIYAAVDSTKVELQPVYENNLYMYLYFIIFAISCFYSLNFFLRFIIASLQKAKIRNHIFMTEDQVLLSRAMRRLLPMKTQKTVPRPQNRCQAWVFDLVTKPCFEFVMVVLVCLNMVCMMVETYDMSVETEENLYWFHFCFIIIFFVEFVIKVIALRKHYFHDGWNIIDFVVLIITIAGLFITDIMFKYFTPPTVFPLLRLGRICRLLYVIPPARGIRKLLLGFVTSLPALFNIVVVLLLLNVTFSIFGMFNFAHVKEGAALDDMYNFKTFGNSMICMFMVSVSGGWDGLLYPILNTPPDCDPYQKNPGLAVVGDCGRPMLGIIFFSTYVTLTFLLAICLYITVILGTYNYEGLDILSDKDLRRFHNTWKKYDPDASQFMPYSKLSEFCDSLQDPLRIPKPNAVKLTHMDLPLCLGDKVHCVDVLLSLAKQMSGDAREMNFLKARVEKMFGINSSQVPYVPISSTLRRKQEEAAAKVIQRAYRKGLLRHGEGERAEQGPVNGI